MGSKELIDMGDGIKLLLRLTENSDATFEVLSEELGVSISTLKRLVRKMRTIGVVIENAGSRRKPRYKVVDWGIINVDALVGTNDLTVSGALETVELHNDEDGVDDQ